MVQDDCQLPGGKTGVATKTPQLGQKGGPLQQGGEHARQGDPRPRKQRDQRWRQGGLHRVRYSANAAKRNVVPSALSSRIGGLHFHGEGLVTSTQAALLLGIRREARNR